MQAAGGLWLTSSTEALTKVIRGMGWKPNGPGCCRQSPTAPAPRLPFRRLYFYSFFFTYFGFVWLFYCTMGKKDQKNKKWRSDFKIFSQIWLYIPDNAIQIFNYPFFFLFFPSSCLLLHTHTLENQNEEFLFFLKLFSHLISGD